jgi:ribosome-binding ATPase
MREDPRFQEFGSHGASLRDESHEGAEATARSLRRGSTAWDAAGKVHTDFQVGFVRAEVIGWRELVEAGGYAAARERGLLRTEGRDYLVSEGDILTIRV